MSSGLIQSGIEYIIKNSTAAGTAGVLGSLKKIEKEVTGVQSMLKTGLTIGLGVLGISSVVSEIREVADEIDKTAKASDRLGISTESYTSLQYAASRAGVGVDQLRVGIEQMTRKASEAAQGTGEARKEIAELGVNAADLARQSPEQMLYELADAMAGVENPADRVRIAIKLFGESGARMVNMLQEGSGALRDTQAEAARLGITFSRIDAGQVEAAKDAWARMSSIIKGIETRAIIELAPYVEGITEALTDAMTAGGGFGEVMVSVFEAVGIAVSETLEEIQKLANPQRSIGNWAYNQGLATEIDTETRRRYEAALGQQKYRQSPYEDQIVGGFGTVVAHQQGAPRYQDMFDAIQKQVTADFAQYTDNPYAGPDYSGRFEKIVADAREKIAEAQNRGLLDTIRQMYEGTTVEQGTNPLESILPEDLGLGLNTGLSESSLSSVEIGTQWTQEAANIEQAIAKVRQQAEALQQTLAGVYKAEDRLAFADQAAGAFGEGTSAYADAVSRYGEALDALKFQETAQEAQEARSQVSQLGAALDTEQEIIGRLTESHDRAADMVEYERAVRRGYAEDLEMQTMLIDRYREGLDKLRDAEFVNQQMESLGDTLSEIAVDFENAADAAESFLRSLAQQSISQYITQPMVSGIGSWFSQLGTAGTATGATDISSGISGTAYVHSGGVMGVDSLPRRDVDASVFRGARRCHTGLMPGEVPAILKRTEGVFTEGQMAALGRGMAVPATGSAASPKNLSVRIVNESSSAVQADSAGMDFDLNDAVVSILLRDHDTGGRTRGGLRR
ncbi:hypothetical protein M0R72_14495 [Candidatus Pacearchaeota archaeon]|jgi:hypothetical protein|nr:hypothetical protein [Candidatus Pacearchaeota archaeon]